MISLAGTARATFLTTEKKKGATVIVIAPFLMLGFVDS
jgi:hypothetical protein